MIKKEFILEEHISKEVDGSLDYSIVNALVSSVVQLDDEHNEKRGGYFAVWDDANNKLQGYSFGTYPEEKRKRYVVNALEKVMRLFNNGEMRSMNTRNPDLGKWGGGISYPSSPGCNTICAFSGFIEKHDEALSLIYGVCKYAEIRNKENPKKFIEGAVIEASKTNFQDNEYVIPVLNNFLNFLED